jgi:hypothetical protein
VFKKYLFLPHNRGAVSSIIEMLLWVITEPWSGSTNNRKDMWMKIEPRRGFINNRNVIMGHYRTVERFHQSIYKKSGLFSCLVKRNL